MSHEWRHLMGTETHELNATQDFFPQSGKAEVPLDKLSGLSPWRPLEKGAAWSYQKHHHSINTQSSLGKLEQLDIQQGQSGQVRAHLGLLCKATDPAGPSNSKAQTQRLGALRFVPA